LIRSDDWIMLDCLILMFTTLSISLVFRLVLFYQMPLVPYFSMKMEWTNFYYATWMSFQLVFWSSSITQVYFWFIAREISYFSVLSYELRACLPMWRFASKFRICKVFRLYGHCSDLSNTRLTKNFWSICCIGSAF